MHICPVFAPSSSRNASPKTGRPIGGTHLNNCPMQSAPNGSNHTATLLAMTSAASNQSSVQPPPRIIDDVTLINSIIVSAIGSIVSIGCMFALFRRAWPQHQFVADDSAIQFMTRRCRLLFAASALTLADALRNLIQWSMLYEGSKLPNFLTIRIVYIFTFLVALPLETYATCQRCAVIVTRKPAQRKRGLQIALVVCIACMLCAQGGSSFVTFDLAHHPNSDVDDWLNRRFAPIAVIAVMALFPLLIMTSSAWALSVNVRQTRPKPFGHQVPRTGSNKSGSISKVGSATSGSQSKVSDSAGENGSSGPVSGSLSDIGSQAAPSGDSAPSSLPPSRRISVLPSRTRSNLLTNVSTAMLHTATKLRSSSRRPSAATRRHNKASLMYPLTRTFTILTVALTVLWLFALAASTLDFVPNVRSNALNAAINAIAIAIEASFERLIRVARYSQQKRQEVLAVDKSFADDMIGQRDGKVHGIREEHIGVNDSPAQAVDAAPSVGVGGMALQTLAAAPGLDPVGTIQEHVVSHFEAWDYVMSPTQDARQPWGSL
ncbi:hypothetical protein BCR44DRAFT_31057 [Catenaria anguillulae PL171]|uniref:Uncharacterized protein n=1 Tax=Catenaria anguillulae PL171 TaxID=765915 RepID=A0A1Y2HX77_9FUNG|nr:hypothetical protein BCR44DRAFT_31057 [Catenaria anguillulae PL171]